MDIPTHKICTKCNEDKPLNLFSNQKTGKYGKGSWCKECRKQYRKEHLFEINKIRKQWRYKNGGQSMKDNKNCPAFLGIFIGERLCRHLFKDVEVMPNGNVGYDIVCNKGKFIDVKTSCIFLHRGKKRWSFHIRKNQIADWFICIALDNRTNLNPLHMWIIPSNKVNDKTNISIGDSTIHKWDEWKRDINDAQLCCNTIKEKEVL